MKMMMFRLFITTGTNRMQNEESQFKKSFITEDGREVPYLASPTPLPPKHIKKTMDFDKDTEKSVDDFDYVIEKNDDFDL